MRCYTPYELRKISDKLIDGAECDTLLKIANATITAKDSAIVSLQKTVTQQDERHLKSEHAIDECETAKQAKQDEIDKRDRRLKWTKVGWAATAVAEAALILYFMVLSTQR
jgi:hypothetical protein